MKQKLITNSTIQAHYFINIKRMPFKTYPQETRLFPKRVQKKIIQYLINIKKI